MVNWFDIDFSWHLAWRMGSSAGSLSFIVNNKQQFVVVVYFSKKSVSWKIHGTNKVVECFQKHIEMLVFFLFDSW